MDRERKIPQVNAWLQGLPDVRNLDSGTMGYTFWKMDCWQGMHCTLQRLENVVGHIMKFYHAGFKLNPVEEGEHQRLLDMLDKEHKALEEKTEESLLQQSQEFKEILEKCMAHERESNKQVLAAAAKIEKQDMQAAIKTAIKAERENMKKIHGEGSMASRAK
ncbi:Coiled-coil domain-containing protein 91 [Varanus komodoensis]|nr:Coiled-coil domain-containing protein 91 [Varanus komodoensis]